MSDQGRPPITELFADSPPRQMPPAQAISDLPSIRWNSDGGGVILDRFGFVMKPQTLFINHLSKIYAEETFKGYSRNLLDIERVLCMHKGRRGLPYNELDDWYLTDKLRPEMLHHRKVSLGSFRRTMMVYFRFMKFAQSNGFCNGLIGDTPSYRVTLPQGRYLDHPCMEGQVIRNIPKLPTQRDFELVEMEALAMIRGARNKRRFQLVMAIARKLGLRRSENVNLPVSSVPSTRDLAALRREAEAGKRPWTVGVDVVRSKRGGTRTAHFPLSLLEELRDYIDNDRVLELKEGVPCETIFVSMKSGSTLKPSWLTNLYKRAAKRAAAVHQRSFGQIDLATMRPHHARHRAITDMMRACLESGMDPVRAMLVTMDAMGHKSIRTATHYMHLAEAEIEAASGPMYEASGRAERDARAMLALSRHELDRPPFGGR